MVDRSDLPFVPGYQLTRELGRGGMGIVFEGWHLETRRPVALKLIRDSSLASPQELARFRIEADAAARMRHPNIVEIYEVGEHAAGPYLAMELVEGGSLDKYLAGRPMRWRAAAELARTLALAVEHAHAQRVVHRDLKPANILLAVPASRHDELTRSDGQDAASAADDWGFTPKITDFGLAKRLDSESTAWTRDGAILGTAAYMPPEQAAGRAGAIGSAADVYALGAILYELLTGRPPFQADSWNQLVVMVLHNEPLPPTRHAPDVPGDLEAICLRCLEKQPERRYATAQQLGDDLGRLLTDQPVAAVSVDAATRLARLAERDGYQIVGEVGRGPRSVVYRALQEPLKQVVALKVFRSGICTREVWEARLREGAELWTVLAHPQIVTVHGAGWWDDAPYLTMEYVPQGSLADRLPAQRSSVRQALDMLGQVTEIVTYLHRQGVVHGNLKPSNVLLAADGIPRVVDFRLTGGLFQGALPADEEDPAGLGCLAPELLQHGCEPRPYTDIYGLGAILYELLTGRPPFVGVIAQEVREQVASQEPLPPSHYNAEVTVQLDNLCLRCLRKNPWRRYYRAFDVLAGTRYIREGRGSRRGN